MMLEGRRRRFIRQTGRRQAKTIQTMMHTGMTINKYRFGFPLPEVIAVDMLTAGRVVTVMWGYSVETFNCVVGEEIVAGEIVTEEIVVIVGGQSLSIFTMVVKGHFKGLSLRSIRTIFGNNIRSSVVFTTVKLLWLKSASLTHGIALLYGTLFRFSPEQSSFPITGYSRQNDAPIRGRTVKKKRKETNILTAMLLTLTLFCIFPRKRVTFNVYSKM